MRPRLLDLYCGSGGAGFGYHEAGFDVTGVDMAPMPRYPFPFVQGDALEYLRAHGHEYDFIHASPPCQAFVSLRFMWNAKPHADLIAPTRELLRRAARPYVIENVPGAPLLTPTLLCGTMFGLGTGDADLWRHRLFETNWEVGLLPPCAHGTRRRVIGVYGGHGKDGRRAFNTQDYPTAARRRAMGIDWMTGAELSQAIPPAFTCFLGKRFLAK